MKNKILISFLILCITGSAKATIIETTNNSFIDQETGFEWMDFGVAGNVGISFNGVVAKLGTGGDFQGWRLPTNDEVYAMMKSAFLGLGAPIEITDPANPRLLGVNSDLAAQGGSRLDNVFAIMGFNILSNQSEPFVGNASTGLYQEGNELGFLFMYDFFQNNDYSDFVFISLDPFSDNGDLTGTSTLLVKAPEPSTLAILALGMLSLGARRFKK
jgi:hypothetical protein